MFCLTLLTLAAGFTLSTGYQYCYECSSKSALCRNYVYDGNYLTKTPCKSVCFYRNEDNRVFRGCFDGWLGGIVSHDYLGCRTQSYLGDKVEWCFCNGTATLGDDEPCNGAHRDVIAKMADRGDGKVKEDRQKEEENQVDEWRDYPVLRTRSKYFLPGKRAPEGRELKPEIIDDSKDGVTRESLGARFEDVSLGGTGKSTTEKKVQTVECYACHDSSPYCQERVTRPEFVTTTRCRTKCFVRKENNKTYRGCFDGWVTTKVRRDYQGCRTQYYMNKEVRWCFCDKDLCNRAALEDLLSGPSPPEGKQASLNSKDYHTEPPPVVEEGYGTFATEPRTYTASVSSQPIRTIVGMCRGHFDGIYSDPYDCTRFVHCFNGFTYRRLCPPGTVWNNKTKNCDYPHNTGISNCIPRRYTPVYSLLGSSRGRSTSKSSVKSAFKSLV